MGESTDISAASRSVLSLSVVRLESSIGATITPSDV